MLRQVLGMTATQLIMAHDRVLTQAEFEQFLSLSQRLDSGEPLSYIIGCREFYSRQFKVTPATLIPRPETELLVDLLAQIVLPDMRLLDLGTGSGCIGITAKLEHPKLDVTAVDMDARALDVARENAAALGAVIDFYISDWYEDVIGKFNIIVSNPPYIEAGDTHLAALAFEPQHALTDFKDGLSCLRQIVSSAPEYLSDTGWLMVEHGYNQASEVQEMFRVAGFTEISTVRDYAGLDRITYGQQVQH